jgi:hypothetical protein
MIISALLSLLTGAVLGMRFRVFVLLPAIAVTVASILAIEVATTHTAGRAAIVAAAAIAALQIGYLCGVGVRYALALARLRALQGRHLPARRSLLATRSHPKNLHPSPLAVGRRPDASQPNCRP